MAAKAAVISIRGALVGAADKVTKQQQPASSGSILYRGDFLCILRRCLGSSRVGVLAPVVPEVVTGCRQCLERTGSGGSYGDEEARAQLQRRPEQEGAG